MSHKHWAEDADLVERYVREMIPAEERRSFEAHMAECGNCRDIVQRETELAQGVRAFGRKRLKEKLRTRAELERAHHVPWVRVSSAAAVLVMLVGLGIYNRWLLVDEKTESQESTKTGEAKTEQGKRDDSQSGAVANKKEVRATDKDREKRMVTDVEGRKMAGASQQKQPKLDISTRADDHARTSQRGAGVASKPAAREARAEELSQMADFDAPGEIWIEGIVLPEVPADAKRKEPVFQVHAMTRTKEEAEPKSTTLGALISQENIVLDQRPSGALPPSRQAQKLSQRTAVQTLVQPTDDGMRLILYLDTPVPEKDFSTVKAEKVSPDSVVVELPNQRIGYRLPKDHSLKSSKKLPAKE